MVYKCVYLYQYKTIFKIRRGEFMFRLREYKNKKSPSFLQELQTY